MTAAKDFNKTRSAFMRRASAPNVTPFALKLAYVVAFKYMNRETQTARPAQETLAADLNVSIRTVQRLLDILQPLGLVIVPGHGPNRASTYWIEPEKATPLSPINTTPVSPIGRSKRRQPATENTTSSAKIGDRALSPQPIRRTKKGTKKRERARSPDDVSPNLKEDSAVLPQAEPVTAANDAFARLWAVYPHRKDDTDEDEARKEFAQALDGGAHSEALIARATCLRFERGRAIAGGDKAQFTPYLANWLKKKKYNAPYPDGVVVDEAGNVVAIEREDDSGKEDYGTRFAEFERDSGARS
jgi:hypothetical protein